MGRTATVSTETALLDANHNDPHDHTTYAMGPVPINNKATLYVLSDKDCKNLRQAIRQVKADLFHTTPQSQFYDQLVTELNELLWGYNVGSSCAKRFGAESGLAMSDPRSLYDEITPEELAKADAERLAYDAGFRTFAGGPTKEDLEQAHEIMDWIHGGLDVIGLIPIVGEGADFVNGTIYALDGDWNNAVISWVGMIPIAGDTAKLERGVIIMYQKGGSKAPRFFRHVKPPEVPKGQGPNAPAAPGGTDGKFRDAKGKYRNPDGTFAKDPNGPKTPKWDTRKARKAWERANGRKWPTDPSTGENFDVHHKTKVSEGGDPYDPTNILPMHPKKHDRYHAKDGPDPN
jgi:hypothetical protein